MSENFDSIGRRSFVGLLGAAVVGAAGPVAADEEEDPFPSEYRVSGHKVIRREVTPESVTVHVRKVSDDLQERYGAATVERTDTVERENPETDALPERATDTWRRPWETYYATEGEWESYFTGPRTESDHPPVEGEDPYATWEFEATGDGYDVAAPMNVVTPASMSDVVDVLDDNGYTTSVVQYDRSAWNSETDQFETQHASAATGTFGFLGRKHVKFWEFEGYTSGSAHVDSPVPHEATSFEDAEQHVEDIFDDEGGWTGWDDYYDLNNGGMLDHDGSATRPYNL
jgi:hypothetical protein